MYNMSNRDPFLHPRNTVSVSQQMEIESQNVDHVLHPEEICLHQYRHRIQHYQSILPLAKNWEYYKKIVNPCEFVYTQKKYDTFPESVCSLKPLSRSYFKLVEMLQRIGFFDAASVHAVPLKTAHVCEGPGGFIEAVFDEAARHRVPVQVSIAMTLKSRHATVPGWKRASNFLKRHHNVKVIYGEDQTGDIMKPENQQYFIDYATHPYYGGKVDLFTADGGFDFSSDYTRQEKMILPLLIASTKIGLEVLKPGGTFILKIFDNYYKATQDLIYFLSCHFDQWTLYKPAMSRPCNPEQYFIGHGFVGCTDEVRDVMRLWCSIVEANEPLDSLLRVDPPQAFQETLTALREKSFRSQIRYLEHVFQLIDQQDDAAIQACLQASERASREWCIQHNMPIYERTMKAAASHNDPPISSPQ